MGPFHQRCRGRARDEPTTTGRHRWHRLMMMMMMIMIKKKPQKTKASPLKMLLPNGPLTRNVNLLVAHAPGILGKFSPSSRLSYTDMHHGTCVTHALWCKPGSLTSSFLWSRRREKHSRHFRCMHNPQFCIFGKRPMDKLTTESCYLPLR